MLSSIPRHRSFMGNRVDLFSPCGVNRSRRATISVTVARNNPGGQSRLIIPGRGGRPQDDSPANRLVLPGQERGSKGVSINTQGVPAPSTSQFRPPPGFMDAADPLSQAAKPFDQNEAQQALGRLRSSAGAWHELAELLPGLSAAGYDSTVVEMDTGLERATQNVWAVAQQVHDSLKKSGKLSPETMAFFDHEESANVLYHMRFLPVSARPAVAEYIVDRQLDAAEANVLARAVKEQERREGNLEGFTATPADCMAFKYYRDAQEARVEHERKRLIEKGLSVAESSTAIAALEALLGSKPESVVGAAELKEAHLEIVRLTGQEVDFRPVPLAGELADTPVAVIQEALRVTQTGIFNAFTLPAGSAGQQFVALPAFRSLLFARSPVALSIADCAAVPAIMKASKATSEEDKRRQAGPALVLLDRKMEETERDVEAYYVRAQGSGCELVSGSDLAAGEAVVGKVLFVCRSPARASQARLDSYSLMSL